MVNNRKRLLALLMAFVMVFTLLPTAALADAATGLGFNQAVTVFDTATGAAADVTVLNSVTTSNDDGSGYFLSRVNKVYDISEGKDMKLQFKFSAGMNNWSAAAWKNNGMRYLSVVDVKTGEVVANYRDDGTEAGKINGSGKYQIGYGLAGTAANSEGLLYTIPHAALEYSTAYWVVMGSATAGNNNAKMLFVPVIFEVTTSAADGTGSVSTTETKPAKHSITVETVGAASGDKVQFNRMKNATTGAGSTAEYAVGDAITAAVPGWEIPLVITDSDSDYKLFIIADGEVVPVNAFASSGSYASNFGDVRFTMPNAAVTVKVIFSGYTAATGVTLDKATAEVKAGEAVTLAATVAPAEASVKDVVWTTSDSAVATVENGKVTGVKEGTATITAKAIDGGFKATCEVTVSAASVEPSVVPATGVTLDKEAAEVPAGSTVALTATVAPEDATNKNVVWTTSDSAVATVENGTVTGVAAGTATITATTEDGSFKATCEVKVLSTAVTGITLDKATADVAKGKTVELTATVAPEYAANKQIVWSTTDANVATVDNGVVTGVAVGTATIMVVTVDGNFSATCKVTVTDTIPALVDGYYQVYTAEQLNWISQGMLTGDVEYNANIKLMADIDLSTVSNYMQLGYGNANAYTGIFDGGYHTINIENSQQNVGKGGVFNWVNGATIKNLKLTGNFTVRQQGSPLVMYTNKNGSTRTVIENVANYVNVNGGLDGNHSVAGLVGSGSNTDFVNCANYGNIKGGGTTAGIVANAQYCNIYNCANYGTIENTAANYYNNVGGIAGVFYSQWNGAAYTMQNCFNVGTIILNERITKDTAGTVVGVVNNVSNIQNIYGLTVDGINVVAKNTQASNYDATKCFTKTEAEMKEAGFVTLLSGSGATANRAFVAQENDYPILRWLKGGDTATVKELVIATAPTQTVYDVHESFKTDGMAVQAKYSDDTAQALRTDEYTYAPAGLLTEDVKEIVISYEGKTVSQPISVYTYPLDSVVIKTMPTKTLYTVENEAVDLTGLVLTANFVKDGVTVSVDLTEGYTCGLTQVAQDTAVIPVSYTYEGVTKSVDVPIVNAFVYPLTKVELKDNSSNYAQPDKYMYEIGETPDLTGTDLTVTFSDGTEEHTYSYLVTEGFTLSAPETIAADTKYVTISYTVAGVTKTADAPVLVNVNGEPTQNADGFYEIKDEYQFEWFSLYTFKTDTSAKAILMNDLDLTRNRQFIGYTNAKAFTGTLDGNGHEVEVAITGLANMNNYYGQPSGLINYAGKGAVVKDITVNGYVNDGQYVGAIIGRVKSSSYVTLINCVNNADVSGEHATRVGGLIGQTNYYQDRATRKYYYTQVIDCVNNGTVTSSGGAGGIVDQGNGTCFERCINNGDVISTSANGYIGGIAGSASGEGAYIKECANFGDITLPSEGTASYGAVAGILGQGQGFGGGTRYLVQDSYNAGKIDGGAVAQYVGGIAGQYRIDVTNCYNSGEVVSSNPNAFVGAIMGQTDSYRPSVLTNNYYLDTTCAYGHSNAAHDAVTALTSDELKETGAFLLGEAFIDGEKYADINKGYPVLLMQVPHVVLSADVLELTIGSTATLEAAVMPASKADTPFRWASEDKTIATVVNGKVTAVDAGVTYITATTIDGMVTKCRVVVTCGHAETEWIVSQAATCLEYGVKYEKCVECGTILNINVIQPLGHNYEESGSEPTCTEPGAKVYTCANCGDSYTEDEIPALGHSYEAVVTAPTCTEKGYTTYTCAACGDSYTADETAALGHTASEWIVDVEATETAVGSQHKECTVCGEELEKAEIPKIVTIPDGWNKIDGKWYAYKDGQPLTGLQTLVGYKRGGGTAENQYYFNADGTMYTGFKKINGAWYFFHEVGGSGSPKTTRTGQMIKNYSVHATTQGYLSAAEKKLVAAGTERDFYYFFDATGKMYTGWHKDTLTGNKWMYFGEQGYSPITSRLGRRAQYGMQKCIGYDGEQHYYMFTDGGVMRTGRIKVSGKYYTFSTSGSNPAKDKLGMRL